MKLFKTILGLFLLTLPITGLIIFMIIIEGALFTLLFWVSILLILVPVILGAYLITSD